MGRELSLIREAIKFYEGMWDFEFLPYVPVAVEAECIKATSTIKRAVYVESYKWLVGSAEQSFLQMIKDQTIIEGRYQAVTDCFRPNDRGISPLHHGVFKKLELISIGYKEDEELDDTVSAAFEFFKTVSPTSKTRVVKTDEGFDIEINGIEVGSYGKRAFMGVDYIYGTGLALPRFVDAANHKG